MSQEKAAKNILHATEVSMNVGGYPTTGNIQQPNYPNPVAGAFSILASRFVATRSLVDTDWWYGDITKAFRYMENWPLETVQAPTNSELEFTQDIAMRWKASERGVFATIEPRAMIECRVAS